METEVKGKYEINHAWEYVTKIPKGCKVMKGKWVFSVKYNEDDSLGQAIQSTMGWLRLLANRRRRLQRDLR